MQDLKVLRLVLDGAAGLQIPTFVDLLGVTFLDARCGAVGAPLRCGAPRRWRRRQETSGVKDGTAGFSGAAQLSDDTRAVGCAPFSQPLSRP